jgi:opacity protein-like surface antigen
MHVRTAYRSSADFPAEFSSEAGFDVGGGIIAERGDRFRTPFSIGGSWRYMNFSGIGVEVETHRSFGEALRKTPCVVVNTRSAEFANQCVGPVEEGFNNEVSTSGKLVYAFPGTRIRPYVTGGIAISRFEHRRPVFYVDANQLQVFDGVGVETGAQVLAGGGVRIALTDHVSIRPDVTFAFADDHSRIRASVGVAYRW